MLGFISDDRVFELITLTAMAGWLALFLSPIAPRIINAFAGTIAVGLLAVTYATLLIALIANGPEGMSAMDFASLDGVTALFATKEAVLVGWAHFLAFDLFVGAWEARTARREGIPFVFVLPCMALTFLAGPFGFLLFLVLRGRYAIGRPPHAALPAGD